MKNKYIKNLIVEQDNQNKILLALEIFFNKLFDLEIVYSMGAGVGLEPTI